MSNQIINMKLQKEMPTAGGSEDPDDFAIAGSYNGKPPELYKAIYYSGEKESSEMSGESFVFRIVSEANAFLVTAKMRACEWIDRFGDTYWTLLQGSWDGSVYSSTDPGPGGPFNIYLQAISESWAVGFRPTKMSLTIPAEGPGSIIDSIQLLDSAGRQIGSEVNYDAFLAPDIDLDFSGKTNIDELRIHGDDFGYSLSDIKFWRCS